MGILIVAVSDAPKKFTAKNLVNEARSKAEEFSENSQVGVGVRVRIELFAQLRVDTKKLKIGSCSIFFYFANHRTTFPRQNYCA